VQNAKFFSFYSGWLGQRCCFLSCQAVLLDDRNLWNLAAAEVDRVLVLLFEAIRVRRVGGEGELIHAAAGLSALFGDGEECWWTSSAAVEERAPAEDELAARQDFLQDPLHGAKAMYFPYLELRSDSSYPIAGPVLAAIDEVVRIAAVAAKSHEAARLGADLSSLCHRLTRRLPVRFVDSVLNGLAQAGLTDLDAENELRRSLSLVCVDGNRMPVFATHTLAELPPVGKAESSPAPGVPGFFGPDLETILENQAPALNCVFKKFGVSAPPEDSDARVQPYFAQMKMAVDVAQKAGRQNAEKGDGTDEATGSGADRLWSGEAMKYLGLDRNLKRPEMGLQRLIKKKVLRPTKINGKLVFDKAELDRLLQKGDLVRRPGRPPKKR
jgi:hypothetical protein